MKKTWLEIAGVWSNDHATTERFFSVGLDVRPASTGVRLDGAEVLRTAPDFFRRLFHSFVGQGGYIHAFAEPRFPLSRRWPQPIAHVVDADAMLKALLSHREISPYPVIFWFVPPQHQLGLLAPSERDLREAAADTQLLHEAINAGQPRLFLDEEFGDLLARPDDRFWICDWIERSASESAAVQTRFRLS